MPLFAFVGVLLLQEKGRAHRALLSQAAGEGEVPESAGEKADCRPRWVGDKKGQSTSAASISAEAGASEAGASEAGASKAGSSSQANDLCRSGRYDEKRRGLRSRQGSQARRIRYALSRQAMHQARCRQTVVGRRKTQLVGDRQASAWTGDIRPAEGTSASTTYSRRRRLFRH